MPQTLYVDVGPVKDITPPGGDDTAKFARGSLDGAASDALRKNMKAAGRTPPPFLHAAHHIVPAGESRFASAIESREILSRFGIDIDSAANGVFLPIEEGNKRTGNALVHRGSHPESYYIAVRDRLKEATNLDEVLATLRDIGEELETGTWNKANW